MLTRRKCATKCGGFKGSGVALVFALLRAACTSEADMNLKRRETINNCDMSLFLPSVQSLHAVRASSVLCPLEPRKCVLGTRPTVVFAGTPHAVPARYQVQHVAPA